MKNKLLKIFALAISLIMLVSTFVACDNSQGGGHTHEFNQKVADETTFKEDATCAHGQLYYYTCSCGEKGTETFEDGRALEHEFDQMKEEDQYLEYEGDCETPATYYYSCKCGASSLSETFIGSDEISHDFVDGECIICGAPE